MGEPIKGPVTPRAAICSLKHDSLPHHTYWARPFTALKICVPFLQLLTQTGFIITELDHDGRLLVQAPSSQWCFLFGWFTLCATLTCHHSPFCMGAVGYEETI